MNDVLHSGMLVQRLCNMKLLLSQSFDAGMKDSVVVQLQRSSRFLPFHSRPSLPSMIS